MAVKKFTTPIATPRASVGRMGSLRLRNWHGAGTVRLVCNVCPPIKRAVEVGKRQPLPEPEQSASPLDSLPPPSSRPLL